MTLPKSITAYGRIAQLLQAIAARGEEAEINCGSKKAAISTRHQIYQYRALLVKAEGSSPYDTFRVTIDPKNENVLLVKNAPRFDIKFNGKPLEVAPDMRLEAVQQELTGAAARVQRLHATGAFQPEEIWAKLEGEFSGEKLVAAFEDAGVQLPDLTDAIAEVTSE